MGILEKVIWTESLDETKKFPAYVAKRSLSVQRENSDKRISYQNESPLLPQKKIENPFRTAYLKFKPRLWMNYSSKGQIRLYLSRFGLLQVTVLSVHVLIISLRLN